MDTVFMSAHHRTTINIVFHYLYITFTIGVFVFALMTHIIVFSPVFAEENSTTPSDILIDIPTPQAENSDIQMPCDYNNTNNCLEMDDGTIHETLDQNSNISYDEVLNNDTHSPYTISNIDRETNTTNYLHSQNYKQKYFKGKIFMVNNQDLDMSALDGTLVVPIIIESSNTVDNQKSSVIFDESTVLKYEDGSLFTGILTAPEMLNPNIADAIQGQDIISVVDVGGNTDPIILQDPSGQPKTSTIKIPAPGLQPGDTVIVNYSQDADNWYFMDTTTVLNQNGSPFVEFQTTHFTLFSIGIPLLSFAIHQDASSTTDLDVVLSMYVYRATHMRFSNTKADITSANWVPYANQYNRTLADRDGDQKVYAQFSGTLGIIDMQDTIFVNRSGSDLLLHIGGSMDNSTVLDSTSNEFHFSIFNSLVNPIINGNRSLLFNGTSQYAERGSVGITDYPFTMAAWARVDSTAAATRVILSIGDSAVNTRYRGIQLVNGQPSMVGRNTTARILTAGGVQTLGDRVHIVGVFHASDNRELYVNGQLVGTQSTVADFSDVNQQVRIGRYPGTATSYFLGPLDDARIYTKALDAQEVADLYAYRETIDQQEITIGLDIFSINSGLLQTYSTGVILNMSGVGITDMKFANTEGGLASADWVSYTNTYNRTLDSMPGDKIVYAAFSGVGGVVYAQDNIFYDDPNTNNIILLADGSMSGDSIIDHTSNGYDLTVFNGVTNTNINGELSLFFNGINQYAERGSVGITDYPFTMAAWVRVDSTVAATRAILSIGNSATNTMYRAIQLVNGQPSLVARNTTARILSAGGVQNLGDRVHVVGVFNASNDHKLYVNGQYVGIQTTAVTFADTNQQVRLGRFPGTATSYFLGMIDDARIYTKALTVGEIANLYAYRAMLTPVQTDIALADFSINDKALQTYSTGVILNMSGSGITDMKFANTEGGLAAADWVSYGSTYSWTLTSGTGNKIVYAAFSGVGGVVYAQDNIFYDDPDANNIILLADGSMSGDTTIIDHTSNAYDLTVFNGVTNTNVNGELSLFFNGINQYAERGSIGLSVFPFTFAAWVRPNSIVGTDVILSIGNSATATMYRSIQLVSGVPSIVGSNTTARTLTAGGATAIRQWRHVVGVFNSSTNRQLYVDGVLVGSQTTAAAFATTNQQVRIGRGVGTLTNYFDGFIDDARIYSKALDATEIADLYQQRVDRQQFPTAEIEYDITSPTQGPVVATLTGASESITIVNNSGSDTYTFMENGSFTFFFQNDAGNVGSAIASVHWIDPPSGSGSVSLSGPNNLSFGSTLVATGLQIIENTFSGSNEYFIIEDTLGSDDGYYTTLDISGLYYDVYSVPNTHISVKTIGSITKLAGDTNNNVVSALGGSYVTASGPITFIKRDPGSNSGLIGTYGAHLSIKIDIPGLQKPGAYTGTITYTLY